MTLLAAWGSFWGPGRGALVLLVLNQARSRPPGVLALRLARAHRDLFAFPGGMPWGRWKARARRLGTRHA